MIRADYKDKSLVVKILAASFADNKSVNYLIKQGNKKNKRIRALMEYSFDVCYLVGDILLSEDKKGCALILFPDKKKVTLRLILLDIKLAISCLGPGNLKKTMMRETKIKKAQPGGLLYYLWFIGVDPAEQNKGIGSRLLEYVISEASSQKRTICLETSTLKNLPWYKKYGFTIYKELEFGYQLYCMKRK